MLILTIRTDKPEAEIGLYDNAQQIAYHAWQAHRMLAETIHKTIKDILKKHNYSWGDIDGIVFYKGPGSFTGLRIGASVANALAQAQMPVVNMNGNAWQTAGIKKLLSGNTDVFAQPFYGEISVTTTQKK